MRVLAILVTLTAVAASGSEFVVDSGHEGPLTGQILNGKLLHGGKKSGSEPGLHSSESVVYAGRDGTTPGTQRVKDINPAGSAFAELEAGGLNGQLLFFASDGVTGLEPWRSHGTSAGTTRITELNPGSSGIMYPDIDVEVLGPASSLVFTSIWGSGPSDHISQYTLTGCVSDLATPGFPLTLELLGDTDLDGMVFAARYDHSTIPFTTEVLVIPEPGGSLMLFVGIGSLVILYCRRSPGGVG